MYSRRCDLWYDLSQAVYWYRKAATLGDEVSVRELRCLGYEPLFFVDWYSPTSVLNNLAQVHLRFAEIREPREAVKASTSRRTISGTKRFARRE